MTKLLFMSVTTSKIGTIAKIIIWTGEAANKWTGRSVPMNKHC
jgi:hypothetical protein